MSSADGLSLYVSSHSAIFCAIFVLAVANWRLASTWIMTCLSASCGRTVGTPSTLVGSGMCALSQSQTSSRSAPLSVRSKGKSLS